MTLYAREQMEHVAKKCRDIPRDKCREARYTASRMTDSQQREFAAQHKEARL